MYCTLVLQWAMVALSVSFLLSWQVVVQGQVLLGFLRFKLQYWWCRMVSSLSGCVRRSQPAEWRSGCLEGTCHCPSRMPMSRLWCSAGRVGRALVGLVLSLGHQSHRIVTSVTSASCRQSILWNRERVSLPGRDLCWPRKFETFQRALHPSFPTCRRGQIAAGTVIPGLSGSKFPSVPTAGAGPQNPCILQVLSTSLCSHQSRGPSWLQGRAAQPWQLKGSKGPQNLAVTPCPISGTKIVASSSVPSLSAHTLVYFYFCLVIFCKLNNSQSNAIICK